MSYFPAKFQVVWMSEGGISSQRSLNISIQLGKSDGSKVSNLEPAPSNDDLTRVRIQESNAICLLTVELGKSRDTISFIKLYGIL